MSQEDSFRGPGGKNVFRILRAGDNKLASRDLCLVRVGVLARIFRLPIVDVHVKGL